jgi:hypothetical protein
MSTEVAAMDPLIAPSSCPLSQEWAEVPPPEVFARQLGSIDTILPEPDPERLIPSVRVATQKDRHPLVENRPWWEAASRKAREAFVAISPLLAPTTL